MSVLISADDDDDRRFEVDPSRRPFHPSSRGVRINVDSADHLLDDVRAHVEGQEWKIMKAIDDHVATGEYSRTLVDIVGALRRHFRKNRFTFSGYVNNAVLLSALDACMGRTERQRLVLDLVRNKVVASFGGVATLGKGRVKDTYFLVRAQLSTPPDTENLQTFEFLSSRLYPLLERMIGDGDALRRRLEKLRFDVPGWEVEGVYVGTEEEDEYPRQDTEDLYYETKDDEVGSKVSYSRVRRNCLFRRTSDKKKDRQRGVAHAYEGINYYVQLISGLKLRKGNERVACPFDAPLFSLAAYYSGVQMHSFLTSYCVDKPLLGTTVRLPSLTNEGMMVLTSRDGNPACGVHAFLFYLEDCSTVPEATQAARELSSSIANDGWSSFDVLPRRLKRVHEVLFHYDETESLPARKVQQKNDFDAVVRFAIRSTVSAFLITLKTRTHEGMFRSTRYISAEGMV